jgi:hypothetical protein
MNGGGMGEFVFPVSTSPTIKFIIAEDYYNITSLASQCGAYLQSTFLTLR